MGLCSDICAEKKNLKKKQYEIEKANENKKNHCFDLPIPSITPKLLYSIKEEETIKEGLKVEKNENLGEKDKPSDIETNSSFLININYFFEEYNTNEIKINKISRILKLTLLKYISTLTTKNHLESIKNPKLKKIITKLHKDLDLENNDPKIKKKESLPKDIKTILTEKKGNNIFEYAKYIDSIIEMKDIKELIKLYDEDIINKINSFFNNLIQYESLNLFFEEEFIKAQKESIFDYSAISLAILDNNHFNNYNKAKSKCPNCVKKILYHGSQSENIGKITTTEFKYTRKAFYGMGIYFSDILDYISFYSGGDKFEDRRKNFNKILPPNSIFSLIAAEIFYDQKLLKHIRDDSLKVPKLDHFPTYQEIKTLYPDKMVKKNGIHFITVETSHGHAIKDSVISTNLREEGKFIGNEYVITELDQICPIYSLTLKRNEYFVLWRDLNFEGKNNFTEYLKKRELFANEIAKMNIYIENRTESALKFVYKRRYNKMILITSIGLDLSGKKFIEIARKILGSNIIVLIFSSNKKHLEWIKNYPNVLYTNSQIFYEEYIKNYNENDLRKLKLKIEKQYDIKLLDFTEDFLSYPLYLKTGKYSDINCSKKNDYVRSIYIIYKPKNKIVTIDKKGNIKIRENKEKDKSFIWDIIIDEVELTLFSNGYYLGIKEDSNEIIIDKYMKRWNYDSKDDSYLIKAINKNNYFLSLNDNDKLCLVDEKNDSDFIFIDV